jgi:hypothetical protein
MAEPSSNRASRFGAELREDLRLLLGYVVSPLLGVVIAVGVAFVLRGGADIGGAAAAQGAIGR